MIGMIQFILKLPPEREETEGRPIYGDHPALRVIPSPRFCKFDGKAVRFSPYLELSVRGKFTPMSEVKMLQNFYHLVEPDWNIKEFSSRIPYWLSGFGTEKSKEPEIRIGETNEDAGVDGGKLKDFVPEGYRSQAYMLEIDKDNITITAWTRYGIFYGFITLSFLLEFDGEKLILPECTVMDYPSYEFRGLEDDISRGQRPTMDNFKDFIKYMARLKLNVHALYIEDMFKFKRYPQIGEGRAPLTVEEIRELEDFALEHFIEVQPAVEMFGHMDNMLTLPEFKEYAEFPGAQCFDITSEKTKKLVDELLEELCAAFRSKMFHLICDESFDFGLGKSREYIKKKGKARVLAEWYLFLVDTVKKYGKEIPGFAHDIIIHYPETMEMVRGKIPVIFFWSYSDKKKYPTISKLRKKGFEVAAVPTTFDWSRHYPYSDYAEKNTIYMARDGLKRGAKFLVTTKFGDFFNENFRENIRYGLAIEAQASWYPDSPLIWDGDINTEGLKKAYIRFFFGSEDRRIIECMDILNKQNDVLPKFPNGMFNRYWMDPFCRKIKNKEIKYLRRFVKEALKVFEMLEGIKKDGTVKRNIGHLDYLYFAARMAMHFGIKILAAESLWRNDPKVITPILPQFVEAAEKRYIPPVKGLESVDADLIRNNLRDGIGIIFDWLSADIRDQKELYRELWLRLAVKEGSEYPLHRFDVLDYYYTNTRDILKSGGKIRMFQLKSSWIWRSGLRTRWDWGNRRFYYFTGKFPVKGEIKKAYLQGIANNYMQVYLNGDEIGEVLSRFSLSQLPMAKAVSLFDITDKIVKGNNTVCVKAINYANGIGSINLLIRIEYSDGTAEEFITDEKWKYTDSEPDTWPIPANTDDLPRKNKNGKKIKWKKVRNFGRPPSAWMGPISEPNWEVPWKSEISYVFGMRNYVETSIVTFVGEKTFKYLFWLVPLGLRLFGTDVFGFRKNKT